MGPYSIRMINAEAPVHEPLRELNRHDGEWIDGYGILKTFWKAIMEWQEGWWEGYPKCQNKIGNWKLLEG